MSTITSGAKFVTYGFGQVEPNHLSAPQNGQVYAQLPADASINILENGQFAKYDYAKGVVDFSAEESAGPWRMVFNEVKIYRDRETDADFAMIKTNYNARVYSPLGQNTSDLRVVRDYTGEATNERDGSAYQWSIPEFTYPQNMPEGTKMVPRLIKISAGDIYTTNCINEEPGSLAVDNILKVGADGYLAKSGDDNGPQFVVVKVYTMPDNQPGVKLQCIKE